MGRNKYVEAHLPYEIPCHGVCVLYDETIMDKALSEDEKDIEAVKSRLEEIMRPTKNNDYVIGVNGGPNGIVVLIPVRNDGLDQATIKQVLEQYAQLGFDAKLSDKRVFADGRYLDEPYKRFIVMLPAYEIEQEIRRILDTYCHSWKASQDERLGLLFYEGDLGGRNVTICIQNGSMQLAAGLSSANMHYTREVAKYWKQVLKGLEDDILIWAKEHPGLAKKTKVQKA